VEAVATVLLKPLMECHLRITITIINKTIIKTNLSHNSKVTIKNKTCLNIVIKATWNIKLQRGTKTNTAKRTTLKTQ
jgi:citrate lyase gamma subunit